MARTKDNLAPLRSVTGRNAVEDGTGMLRRPESHAEWIDRYNWLDAAFYGEPYTTTDIIALGLFRAVDENGDEISITKRLLQDWRFVIETDANAMTGKRMQLELEDSSKSSFLDASKAVWKRSGVRRHQGRWSRTTAALGDIVWESARTETGTKVIAHDPRNVRLYYDEETRSTLIKGTITIQYFDPPVLTSTGEESQQGVLHVYHREYTQTEVMTWLDGVLIEQSSGPHGLGVVPLSHVSFIPDIDEVEHGLCAAHGLELAFAHVNSALEQIKASGNRFANPILTLRGAKLGADSDILKLGRVVSGLPKDAELAYAEADMKGAARLLETALAVRNMARDTMPEFIFSGAGASSSAEALAMRAGQFAMKMEEVRGRWYDGLVQATEYAVAMEQNRAYDPDTIDLTIAGGPVIPINVKAELEALGLAGNAGLSAEDKVRRLQMLGYVGAEVAPEDYVAQQFDMTADRATMFFAGAKPATDEG